MKGARKQVLNESETETEEITINYDLAIKEYKYMLNDYEKYNKFLKYEIEEKDKLLNITMIILMISGIGHVIVSLYLIFYT
jgi:hypothetical protein